MGSNPIWDAFVYYNITLILIWAFLLVPKGSKCSCDMKIGVCSFYSTTSLNQFSTNCQNYALSMLSPRVKGGGGAGYLREFDSESLPQSRDFDT